MTVHELIQQLVKLPPNVLVFTETDGWIGEAEPGQVVIEKTYHNGRQIDAAIIKFAR